MLYHYADMPEEMSIELSLDQVLEVSKKIGFQIEVLSPTATRDGADPVVAGLETSFNGLHKDSGWHASIPVQLRLVGRSETS